MRMAKGVLLSLATAAALGGALLAAMALACAKMGAVPRGPALALCATLASSSAVFAGGLAGALYTGKKGILLGAGCGLIWAVAIAVPGVILAASPVTPSGIGRLLALILAGCVGGVLGVNKKQRVKF